MGILDAAILLNKETTYGTPVTLTKGFEGKADTMKRQVEFLESIGLRAGLKTLRSDRRKIVTMGATGSLEIDFLTAGMVHLVQGLLTFASTSGAGPYTHTFEARKDDPGVSFTMQVLRPIVEGATQQFTYHGVVPTAWRLSNEVGGNLMLNVDFDAEDEDTSTAAGTPAYPATAVPFDWTQSVVTLAGGSFEPDSFEFSADLAVKTDRRFLRGSALKKKPVRNAVPSYEGTLVGDFTSLARYTDFVAGTVVALSVVWTSGTNVVTLSCPAVQFNGETPEVSLDELGRLSLPYKVLDNGTNPPVTLTVVTPDATLA